MLGEEDLQALANDAVNGLTEAELRIEALEARWDKMESSLAAVQEAFLAEAVSKGYDGSQTTLYALIVALRITATS